MARPPPVSPPVPIYLCGSKPGVFDPTQPSRLLRCPDSTLLFASFSPALFTDALPRACRIVVELPRASDSSERPNFFSFVPNAVLAPGVASEGKWPRVVDYCGRRVVCDQDQWDIHKLDPLYDCFVPTTGIHPTITRKIDAQLPGGGGQTRPGKRGLSSSEVQGSDSEHSGSHVPVSKTTHVASSTFTVSASSDEFASIGNPATCQSEASFTSLTSLAGPSTLESPPEPIPSSSTASVVLVPSSSAPCLPSATPAESSEPNIARQWITASVAPSSAVGSSNQTAPNAPEVADDDVVRISLPTGPPDSYLGKRKTFHHLGSDESDSSTVSSETWRAQKRSREVPSTTLTAVFDRKKAQRRRDRERGAEVFEDPATKKFNNQFWSDKIVARAVEDSLHSVRSDHGGVGFFQDGPAPQLVPELTASLASASIASGPDPTLASGASGQPAAQSQVNVRLDENAAHQASRQQAIAQDVAAESPLFAHPEPQINMPWTPRRAIERYLAISQQFDSARFSAANPVDLLCIPWPVLHPPFTHQLPQIDWQMVDAFFQEASRHMCVHHYKVFISASRKRFHPDRWLIRGVFGTDDSARSQFLRRASMIISQVLNPIWDDIKFPEAEAD